MSRNALSEDSAQPPPDGARDYLVFAFFLDRLPPNAETGLLVAEKEEGVDGDAGQPLIIDDQGWRVVVQRVTFAANGGRPLYFKALYRTEGDVAKQSGAHIVAQISSQLGPARPAGGTSQPPSRTRLSVPNLLDRN